MYVCIAIARTVERAMKMVMTMTLAMAREEDGSDSGNVKNDGNREANDHDDQNGTCNGHNTDDDDGDCIGNNNGDGIGIETKSRRSKKDLIRL